MKRDSYLSFPVCFDDSDSNPAWVLLVAGSLTACVVLIGGVVGLSERDCLKTLTVACDGDGGIAFDVVPIGDGLECIASLGFGYLDPFLVYRDSVGGRVVLFMVMGD
jgi:hypothetical protein